MPGSPDADQLLTLLAVAEAGNESAAAERLGVGQSSVSRRLAALQKLSEAPLTHRAATGTRLTSAGAALLGPARALKAALLEAGTLMDPAGGALGKVRCGVSPHLVARFAGAAATSRIEVELVEAHSDALVNAVRRGELPAAVTLSAPAGGEPGLRVLRAGEERLVLAALPGEGALRTGPARSGTEPAGLAHESSREAGPRDTRSGTAALGLVKWLLPAAPSVVGERARALLRRAGLAAAAQTPVPSPGAMRAAVLAGAGVGVALRSELAAEAAAGWLALAPLPFGAEGDDVVSVWLVASDSLGEDHAESLTDLVAEAMRG